MHEDLQNEFSSVTDLLNRSENGAPKLDKMQKSQPSHSPIEQRQKPKMKEVPEELSEKKLSPNPHLDLEKLQNDALAYQKNKFAQNL